MAAEPRRGAPGVLDDEPVPVEVDDPLESPPRRPPAASMPAAALRRSTWFWVRSAAILASVFLGYQLILILHTWVSALLTVILYVVFGAIIAFIATPAVGALQKYARLPRALAVLLTLLGLLGLLALLVFLAAGPAVSEAKSLSAQIPGYVNRANSLYAQFEHNLADHGVNLGSGGLPGGGPSQVLSHAVGYIITGVTGTLNVILDIIVTLVVAFWILNDGDELRAGFVGILPSRVRSDVEFGLDAIGVVIGGYVRAQLFMAFLIGAFAGVGCALLGVPFPLVIALAAGVFELVPLVGPFIGGAVALLLALTVSPVLAVFTVLLFLGIHIIEGYVLAPRIQARFVRLHPLVALLSLFAGIEVAGFLGALFAVPAASLAAVFLRAAIGDWRANRPDMFTARRADLYIDRRRRTILREFRLFQTSPAETLARSSLISRLLRRAPGDESTTGH